MEKQNLVIIGAGGHAKVVFDIVETICTYNVIAFVDQISENESKLFDVPVRKDFAEIAPCAYVVAIGDNKARSKTFEDLKAKNFKPTTLIHPSAVISKRASIGAGTVIMPNAVVNADAKIGIDCIINTGAIIEHDCVIGNHSHISVGVCLAGNVHVGDGALVGVSASARPHAKIGSWSTVGVGAVVIKDIPDNCTAVGVPARPVS